MKSTMIASAVMLSACFAFADYKSSIDEANQLTKDKKYTEATAKWGEAFQAAEKLNDKLYAGNNYIKASRSQGEPQQAIDTYKKLLESTDLSAVQEAGLLMDFGNFLMDLTRFQEAPEYFKKVTEMADANAGQRLDASWKLSNCLFRNGDAAGAKAVAEKSLAMPGLNPKQLNQAVSSLIDVCVYTNDMKRLSEALALFNTEDPSLNDGDKFGVFNTQNCASMLMGKNEDAITYGKKAAGLKVNLWQRRGLMNNILEAGRRLGKPAAAIEAARSLMLPGDKDNVDLFGMLIQYEKSIVNPDILALYDEALALPNVPENKLADLSRQKADTLRDLRKYDEAIVLLEKALTTEKLAQGQIGGLYKSIIYSYNDLNRPEKVYETAKAALNVLTDENQKAQIARDSANALAYGIFGRQRLGFAQGCELLDKIDLAKLSNNEKRSFQIALSEYYYNAGKVEKAAEYCRLVTEKNGYNKWQAMAARERLQKMGLK